MNEYDHLPSISNIQFLDMTRVDAIYMLVPSCRECNLIASDTLDITLEERIATINKGLEEKYKKNIIASMKEIDTSYMSPRLRKSVDLFSEKGLEALDRIKFNGFDFEINGMREKSKSESRLFLSCGDAFHTLTEAVNRACEAYSITIDEFNKEYRLCKSGSIDEIAASAAKNKFIKKVCYGMKAAAKKNTLVLPRSTLEEYVRRRYLVISNDFDKEVSIFITFLNEPKP